MAKLDKEEQARRDGMAYALKIAQERGIEGLEEEIKFRNATFLPIAVPRAACDEAIEKIKYNTIDTVLVLASVTLRDEFEFGKKRIERFKERFTLKTECLCEDYVTWDDLIQQLKEECGVDASIRYFNDNVRI